MFVILARDKTSMYWHLRGHFAGSGVEILIDRRKGERRSEARPSAVERRRGDRRRQDIGDRLRDFGWVLIGADVVGTPAAIRPADESQANLAERCTECGGAIAPGEGRYRRYDGIYHMQCYEAVRLEPGSTP